MAVLTTGWPVAEGFIPAPEKFGAWPVATELAIAPWEAQAQADQELDLLQVAVVPRAEWERFLALMVEPKEDS